MSADIEKLSVFDGRIVQSRPKYAVEKGALSITNAPFNAIAATSSQHTYNIYVPSENVFVDRALEWSSTVTMQMSVTNSSSSAIQPGTPIAMPGREWALTAFPLNSLCSTMTATINDTTAVINSQDVLKEVLRLTDYKKQRLQRTCPTMLDKYQSYDDSFLANNNPLGGYEDATAYDEVPNGAFWSVVFCDSTGSPLGTASSSSPANGLPYDVVSGVPVVPAGAPWQTTQSYPIYFQFRSTEKLVLSPFVFADTHEWDTGLFGINNIQLIMNLQSSPARLVRSTTRTGRTISAVQYLGSSPFQRSVVNVQFLTPSLDVPLPPKSVVPYMEFPRYITTAQTPIPAGQTSQIQSQTITLPQIPDLLIIYAKPQVYADSTQGDWYLPLATSFDGTPNPLSVNFDNFSGLLSSVTTEQLYAMSVKNGLDMDWNAWVGQGHTSAALSTRSPQLGGGRIPLVGGPLVLKPSQDISLQSGQAPSLVGNFTLQMNITVKNTSAATVTPQLFIITVNSGFFESIRGSSRIIKGVLSEQDIISAPLAMGSATRSEMQRSVGSGSGLFSSLANVLSKAKSFYDMSKPAVSAIKGMLPEGRVKGALGAVGYGSECGGIGAGIGAGGRTRKGLSARLM